MIVDLDDDEARIMLTTFDPIGAMAETGADALQQLLEQIPALGRDMDGKLLDIVRAAAWEDPSDGEDGAFSTGAYRFVDDLTVGHICPTVRWSAQDNRRTYMSDGNKGTKDLTSVRAREEEFDLKPHQGELL